MTIFPQALWVKACAPQRIAQRGAQLAHLVLLSTLLLACWSLPVRAQECTGDCDSDGFVTIEEIITGVGIGQGTIALSMCEAFDTDQTGAIEVYEIIAAVGDLLNGCGAATRFTRATKSAPLALTLDNRLLVVANTDTNSVTIFEVRSDGTLRKIKELGVGREPRSVAVLPDATKAYVANTVSGTVSVIDLHTCATLGEIAVGTEPYALAPTPNGMWVYVANANSNSVSVIRSGDDTVIGTIPVGRSPRALAITNDLDGDDSDEKVYVPNFFARPRTGFTPPSSANLGGTDGAAAAFPMGANGQPVIGEGIFDDSREGVVDVISVASNTVVDQVTLAPLADTGFNIARGAFVNMTPGDAPRTIFADGATDGAQPQRTGAFPNMFQSIAIFGDRAFLPNTAASPEPPLRFNGNLQSLLSVLNVTTDQETTDTFNMNRGINFDVPPGLSDAQIRDNIERLFPSVPVDIDCAENTNTCWVVSQGSDFIVRVDFPNNTPTINAPTAAGPFPVSPVARIFTIDTADPLRSGRNPRGIVIDSNGIYGYVSCPTTRDVIVMNLAGATVMERVRSSALPTLGSREESIRRGKIDFFTSRPPWSDRGWGGCAGCHPEGGTDTVTWSFEAGPRQTIGLDGTFNKNDPEDHRALNWTPVRDENQDFELNTRGIFGGRGFINVTTDVNGDGITPDSDPNVRNFGPASSGRASQQEDITAFVQQGIRSAIAPPSTSGNVMRGRDLFGNPAPAGANCVACHSGAKWTTSRITYDQGDINPMPGMDTGIVNVPPEDLDNDGTIDPSEERAVSVYLNGFNSMAGAGRVCEVPPPLPGVDVGAVMASERIRIMRQVGTFAATNPIEVRHGSISPINTVAPMLAVNPAFGADGFNAPSLLSVADSAPYFRHGTAQTLEQALGIGTDASVLPAIQAHRRAGTGGMPNVLDSDPSAVTDLVAFVRTIDERTAPFRAADLAPNDPVFADANALCDCQKDPPAGNPVIDCMP